MGTAARNFYFNLDNSSGTPVDLSTYLNAADETTTVNLEDSTTFGSSVVAKSNTVTLYEGGFIVRAPFHATLNTHLKALKGLTSTSTFILGPQGSTSGQERITGECRMTSFKRTGEVAGILRIEAEFRYDGTITEDTF